MSDMQEGHRPLSRGEGNAELLARLTNGSIHIGTGTLDLSGTDVSDEGMKALALHCPQLHTLDLHATRVSDEGTKALAERCPQLHTVDLDGTDVSDEGVEALAKYCRQLSALRLRETKVTDEGVKALALHCPQLHTLDLSGTDVSDEGTKALAERCPQLHTVDLDGTDVSDEGVEALAKYCRQLSALRLRETKVTDEGVKALALHCPQLRELALWECKDVTDEAAVALAERCPQLHTVDLDGTDVSDEGVKALAERCPQLHTFHLGSMSVTDEAMKTLAHHYPQLRMLRLHATDVSDEGLTILAQSCKQLHTLHLSTSAVTDDGVKTLAKHCSQLVTIELWHCYSVTDDGVKALAKHCSQLVNLELWACYSVTDDGVKALAKHGKQLRLLDLTETGVTDEGVGALALLCPQLATLKLSGCDVDLPKTLNGTTDAQAIFRYFREARASGSRALLEIKVSVLGIGRLGKSQLARRLAPMTEEERTRPYIRDAESTHAFVQRVAKLTTNVGGVELECLLRFFDFGGQPEMHGTHRFFLADQRNVYIVLVSARKSRAANRLDYWLRMVKYHGRGSPVVVVVSHNDAEPSADELYYRAPSETLESLDAEALAREHGIPIQIVGDYSNATGKNLDQVWKALSAGVTGLRNVFDVPFAPDFFKIHAWTNGTPGEELQDHPKFDRYLSVRRFREACAAVGQNDKAQQCIWLVLLRDLGLLHYVGDRPEVMRDPKSELSEFFYHPEWVKTPVYNVVRHPDAYENNGILPFSRLSNAIATEVTEPTDRKRVVALMEACELIFRVRGGRPEDADYLIVDRVPGCAEGMGREKWTATPKKRLRWVFTFLSDHLLAQLLGRWFSQVPSGAPYFRDDIVLASHYDATCQVRLRARVNEHAIDLDFDAQRDKEWEKLLIRVEAEIESILDPEGLRRTSDQPLWQKIDPDNNPAKMLSTEEQNEVSCVAEAIMQSHELDSVSKLFEVIRKVIQQGFESSLSLSEGEKRAYRACWAFSCHRCIQEQTLIQEVAPLASTIAEMELVIAWLDEAPAVRAALLSRTRGKTLDTAEALRGSYKNALKKLPRRPHQHMETGDLGRHAARPDLPRDQ